MCLNVIDEQPSVATATGDFLVWKRFKKYWRDHADMLEQKFTTGHGKHYSHFLK